MRSAEKSAPSLPGAGCLALFALIAVSAIMRRLYTGQYEEVDWLERNFGERLPDELYSLFDTFRDLDWLCTNFRI
jgi:hypothetical protein